MLGKLTFYEKYAQSKTLILEDIVLAMSNQLSKTTIEIYPREDCKAIVVGQQCVWHRPV